MNTNGNKSNRLSFFLKDHSSNGKREGGNSSSTTKLSSTVTGSSKSESRTSKLKQNENDKPTNANSVRPESAVGSRKSSQNGK